MDAYKTLIRHIQTEKSNYLVSANKYSFQIHLQASKLDTKRAVEQLYGVDVVSVNTMRMKGKVKNYRGRPSKGPDWKKAVVKIRADQNIDYTTFKAK